MENTKLRNGTGFLGSVALPPSHHIRPEAPVEPRTPHSRCRQIAKLAISRLRLRRVAQGVFCSFPAPGHCMRLRATVLVLAIFTALPAHAQVPSGFPARPVKFLIPFPGGGIN